MPGGGRRGACRRIAPPGAGVANSARSPSGRRGHRGECERAGVPRGPQELSQHECLVYSSVMGDDRWQFNAGTANAGCASAAAGGQTVAVRGRLRSNSLSAVQWSSFEGMEFTARVHATYSRGQLVHDGGKIVNAAGYGRFLRPAARG